VPPVFSLIQKLENVDETQMFFVFNMGIGFCAIVAEQDSEVAISILSSRGKRAHRIGYALADGKRRISIAQYGLVGEGKNFRREQH
jgi:phosphoribosylformylglycinamidine cyclo-ligase